MRLRRNIHIHRAVIYKKGERERVRERHVVKTRFERQTETKT